MLISYEGLVELVDEGVITVKDRGAINGASIDVHLGRGILEEKHVHMFTPVNLAKRESVGWRETNLPPEGSFIALLLNPTVLPSKKAKMAGTLWQAQMTGLAPFRQMLVLMGMYG